MEGLYVMLGIVILTAIGFTVYFVIQDRKEEKKHKTH
jgi:heme/copper-type cytochrome/quinol oxidase subunit 2